MKNKTILVDINHPAHVHLFKYFIPEMKKRGYKVIVAAKDMPSIKELLHKYSIDYVPTGKKKDSMALKYFYEFLHLLKVYYLVLVNKVDYGIGISMVLPIASKLSAMKVVAMDDDDLAVTPTFGKFTSLADTILTPSALAHENRGPKHRCHDSFHELAYLHPDRFVPQPAILQEVGVKPGEPFFIMRFNAFKAHHDAEEQGITLEQKRILIQLLKPYGKIFITTERAIEPELKSYQLPVSAEKIHSLMYYATMFIGDSQTMVSEAAVLGTPAIKLNTFAGRLSIPNELEERYGLCYSFQPAQFSLFIDKIKSLLALPDIKGEWVKRREKLLSDKVDLTTFMVNLIANYPKEVSATEKPVARDTVQQD